MIWVNTEYQSPLALPALNLLLTLFATQATDKEMYVPEVKPVIRSPLFGRKVKRKKKGSPMYSYARSYQPTYA